MTEKGAGKPIIIITSGAGTRIFADGKVYSQHITGISFEHFPPEKPKFRIEADVLPPEDKEELDRFRKAVDFVMRNNRLPDE